MSNELYDRLRRDLPWVGRDLDSRTKYSLRLSKELGIPLLNITVAIQEVTECVNPLPVHDGQLSAS